MNYKHKSVFLPMKEAVEAYHQLLVDDHLADDAVDGGDLQLKHLSQRFHAGGRTHRCYHNVPPEYRFSSGSGSCTTGATGPEHDAHVMIILNFSGGSALSAGYDSFSYLTLKAGACAVCDRVSQSRPTNHKLAIITMFKIAGSERDSLISVVYRCSMITALQGIWP